jgi:hypothetical protein
MRILPLLSSSSSNSNDQAKSAQSRQRLIRSEAKLGGQLFGAVNKGHDRQFFCLDRNSWVWHEAWTDNGGHKHSITTRYDVTPNGVFKIQNGGSYQSLNSSEASNLYNAVDLYSRKITEAYQTGQIA